MITDVNLEQCEEVLTYLKANTDRFVKELKHYPVVFRVLGARTIFTRKEHIIGLIYRFEERRRLLLKK